MSCGHISLFLKLILIKCYFFSKWYIYNIIYIIQLGQLGLSASWFFPMFLFLPQNFFYDSWIFFSFRSNSILWCRLLQHRFYKSYYNVSLIGGKLSNSWNTAPRQGKTSVNPGNAAKNQGKTSVNPGNAAPNPWNTVPHPGNTVPVPPVFILCTHWNICREFWNWLYLLCYNGVIQKLWILCILLDILMWTIFSMPWKTFFIIKTIFLYLFCDVALLSRGFVIFNIICVYCELRNIAYARLANISGIYKSIILIFSVNLSMVIVYKFCKM